MDEDLTKHITERLSELPESVRQAGQSAELQKKIQALGVKRAPHIDQVGALEDETLMVMLGFSDANTFEKSLTESLKVSPELGKQLAADVNTDIFLPIRDAMRTFMEKRGQAPPPAPSPVPAPKPAAAPHPADVVLTEKTVTAAPHPPAPPTSPEATKGTAQLYKAADPYREPLE